MFALLANLIGISREKPGRKLPFVYIRRFTLFSFDSGLTITAPSTYPSDAVGKKRGTATCREKPWSRGKCRARRNDARMQLPQNSMDTVCWALLIPCGHRLPRFFTNSSDKRFLLRVCTQHRYSYMHIWHIEFPHFLSSEYLVWHYR